MAFKYFLYDLTYGGTVIDSSNTSFSPVNPLEEIYIDYLIPETQPYYLYANSGGTGGTIIVNNQENIDAYLNATELPPTAEGNVTYGEFTGTTSAIVLSIDTLTGTTLPAEYYNKTQINSYSANTLTNINTRVYRSGDTMTGTLCTSSNLFASGAVTGSSVCGGVWIHSPIICGETKIQAPIITGSTCVTTSVSCATVRMQAPVVCGGTCVISPITIGSTCVCSPRIVGSISAVAPIVSGSTCVIGTISCATTRMQSPIVCGGTCSSSPLHCGACMLATSYICSPVITGSTRICSPLICGTTCAQSPLICGTTRVQSPIVCGSTCSTSPITCGTTRMQSPIVCATSCVRAPLVSGTTMSSINFTATCVCGTTCVKSPSISGGTVLGSTCVSAPITCATTRMQAPIITGSTCIQSPIVSAASCLCSQGTTRLVGATTAASTLSVSGITRLANTLCYLAPSTGGTLSDFNVVWNPVTKEVRTIPVSGGSACVYCYADCRVPQTNATTVDVTYLTRTWSLPAGTYQMEYNAMFGNDTANRCGILCFVRNATVIGYCNLAKTNDTNAVQSAYVTQDDILTGGTYTFSMVHRQCGGGLSFVNYGALRVQKIG